jgi:hypothetical protein
MEDWDCLVVAANDKCRAADVGQLLKSYMGLIEKIRAGRRAMMQVLVCKEGPNWECFPERRVKEYTYFFNKCW